MNKDKEACLDHLDSLDNQEREDRQDLLVHKDP